MWHLRGTVSRLPPALLLAIPLYAALLVVRVVVQLGGNVDWLLAPGYQLGAAAAWMVVEALLAIGAFELARRGREGRAARLAGWLYLAQLGLSVVYIAVNFAMVRYYDKFPRDLYELLGYATFAVSLAAPAALVASLGGFRRYRVAGVVALVAAVAAHPPPFLHEVVYGLGRHAVMAVFTAGRAVLLGVVAWLLVRGAPSLAELPEDGAACEAGYARAASSLWLRILAAVVLSMVVVLASTSRRGVGSLMQLVLVIAPLVNALGLGLFAAGAFAIARSGLRDVARGAATVAGALSLWAAGVIVAQAPWLYLVVHGDGDGRYGYDDAAARVQALAIAVPLAAAAGIVVLALTVGGLARRRSLETLREQAGAKTTTFVALLGASLAIQQLVLPRATTMSGFLGLTLIAAVVGLAAIASAAKLFRLAADAIHEAPGLPIARLVEPGGADDRST